VKSYPPVTPESVASAKADAKAIRDQLRREFNIDIADDGTITLLNQSGERTEQAAAR
jgi:hypothetical protein